MIIDCHNHIGADPRFILNWFPYAQDLPSMVNTGRQCGVGRWVVFPMSLNLTFDLAALRRGERREEGGIETVPYAFENRRMIKEIDDFFPELAPFIIPFAMVDPVRHTEAQVRALRELYQYRPFHGLKIQATTLRADILGLRGAGKCMVEFAAEYSLPFLIHSSVDPHDPWSQAESILRVAEATPTVRFCLAHSCRFDRLYLNRVAELPNTWFDCSAHLIHCLAAVQELAIIAPPSRRFDSDYRDPARVLYDLAENYPRKLLWGSDSPFYTYISDQLSLRSTYAAEVDALKAMPAPLRQRVSFENTREFLRLKDEAILSD